jgi:hypothetical protein
LLVIGKHVPQLSFLDTLLGNEPVFEPKMRIYQRLLAGDQEEAAELIDEYLERRSLVDVYDSVLIPALAAAEAHWRRGLLAEDRHRYILQSLKEIMEDVGQRPPEGPSAATAQEATTAEGDSARAFSAGSPPPCVLCLPARDEGDEIAALMLAQVLEASGCVTQAFAVTTRASELVDLVAERDPIVACISATPPAPVMHARHLSRRLRARLPDVHLVVGLWDSGVDLARAKDRIGCGERVTVVATLADAQEQVRRIVRPPLPTPDARDAGTYAEAAIDESITPVCLR